MADPCPECGSQNVKVVYGKTQRGGITVDEGVGGPLCLNCGWNDF